MCEHSTRRGRGRGVYLGALRGAVGALGCACEHNARRPVPTSMCRGPSSSTWSPLSSTGFALVHTASSSTQSSSSQGKRMKIATLPMSITLSGRRLSIYAWTACANLQTTALGCRDSGRSMLLVVVLALDLVHCYWSLPRVVWPSDQLLLLGANSCLMLFGV